MTDTTQPPLRPAIAERIAKYQDMQRRLDIIVDALRPIHQMSGGYACSTYISRAMDECRDEGQRLRELIKDLGCQFAASTTGQRP